MDKQVHDLIYTGCGCHINHDLRMLAWRLRTDSYYDLDSWIGHYIPMEDLSKIRELIGPSSIVTG